jgi:hypothetical protein
MSKAKPYFIGAALGASTMLFALQYHVVNSQSGFRIIPRTPQQSMGLAYADVRNWTPSQWTDRPELARALMAHGASDLIAESVADNLTDAVSEDGTTLDELRSFLNQVRETPPELPDSASNRSDADVAIEGATEVAKDSGKDLFRIPFPQDARKVVLADPFRAEQLNSTASSGSSDALGVSRVAGINESPVGRGTAKISSPSVPQVKSETPSKSVADQVRDFESRMFGDSAPAGITKKEGTPSADNTAVPANNSEAMFEEITSRLENRAQEALDRAQQSVRENTSAGVDTAKKDTADFLRSRITDSLPTQIKSPTAAVGNPSVPSASPLTEFDPFLE